MVFNFAISDQLKAKIKIISKKDKTLALALNKKIIQVINSDEFSINYYKNLRHDLKEYKRVHVLKSFVLLFKVFNEKNFILFDKFDHHDNIYKNKK